MPHIFDNISLPLLPTLQAMLGDSFRADFCVGYFNLRGWQALDAQVAQWAGGEGAQCRLLVGMFARPQDELKAALSFNAQAERMDNHRANELQKELAEEFRQQLMVGAPNNQDEAALRRLLAQLKAGKLVVRLFLRHKLHAKLYLLFRHDLASPVVGYTGSSNLTFAGLSGQGELNLDVLDSDATTKLSAWFDDRWNDRWCVDITEALIAVLEESWASEALIPPYYIYLKMAYHLSREARAGLSEFAIPRVFGEKLFDYQVAAVKIAARHLNERGGVLIGDVVGLGKTLMATALAKIFEDDFLIETLIICPKNLVKMWEFYRDEYHLRARVLSITRVQQELPSLRRYRLVLIDESHNLRNREGKRYRQIQEYIQHNDSRCILLTATPYNKTYLDLSSQLRLFIGEETDLGIRPERLLREMGEVEFNRQHQAPLRSLAAFEKSSYPDDWRELMRLFMVRRTRTFIRENYAQTDPANGRKYLHYPDGGRDYFPTRHARRLTFRLDEADPADQYARLYHPDVVGTINDLNLPRYGLGNYIHKKETPTPAENRILEDLSRGGRRLMGFCRTNLFKRLESSGYAFLLSVERHILRNYIYLHALENSLPVPIGTQGSEMLDTRFEDGDAEAALYDSARLFDEEDGDDELAADVFAAHSLRTAADFQARAAQTYTQYAGTFKRRFKWLRPALFQKKLAQHLRQDAENLLGLLHRCGSWNPARDTKLNALADLLDQTCAGEKVLIFSQFADTVTYLTDQLSRRGVTNLAGVTGDTSDPTELAWRFSPVSNGRSLPSPDGRGAGGEGELRVLIATDILSEGQNLQDAHTVVNYDLPWAIIRLIQRAGRVDRIGQKSPDIFCYTFWPADGVERLIALRGRLRERLRQNAEVVGTDEAFFEDEENPARLADLYNEKAGALDEEDDGEVDLVSHAYQIWKNATDANPELERAIPRLPNVVYSTKSHTDCEERGPAGALVYLKDERGQHALAWIDANGQSVTESQFAVLRAARCSLDTPALPRQANHHELVQQGMRHILSERKNIGGQLGRPSGARFKAYTRLKDYAEKYVIGSLLETLPENQSLLKAIEQLHRFPLREAAKEKLNRQLRSNVRDEQLAQLVATLYDDSNLCVVQEEEELGEPEIICSLGLADL